MGNHWSRSIVALLTARTKKTGLQTNYGIKILPISAFVAIDYCGVARPKA